MILHQTLRIKFIAIGLLIFSASFAAEKIKRPSFYPSTPSARFVTFKPASTATEASNDFAAIQANLPKTLKVMAIRVQFQRDNDRNTTGDGWFDLSTGTGMINPPPHNRRYFANQLRALKDYYLKVSGGKLALQVEEENGDSFVYPLASDSAWTLPHPMAYYNPNQTPAVLDQRLAELFRDAIVSADQAGYIDFSKFDVFIIFHAGVGAEFTQEFDTTPCDIPSVFLNFNDLKKNIGGNLPDFAGIPVNNGTFFIKEGIILPETENQGDYKIFGLLGTAALMMGFQLGLPALFDTDTGHPGIGRFGLMDQGSGNFYGSIPAQPCAWSKIFLGWEQPILISSGDKIPVAAALAANPNKIYKIPINAKEYFLVENRQQRVRETRNIAVGFDANGKRVEFYYGSDGSPIINPLDGIDVITSVNEYDFDLPGSGILIWHIDENIIEQKYAENRVNTDMNHRGVDLVEADGSQDMGYYYNFFGFTGYHAGYAEDMWWDANPAHLFVNSSQQVKFTPFTKPSTHSYARANTGIYITNFSPIDSVMYFKLEIKYYQPGFPAFLGANSGNSALVVGDLNGDGREEIVAATASGMILAWQANGEKLITNDAFTYQISLLGDTTNIPLPMFARIETGHFLHSPALADLTGDGALEVIAGSSIGHLFAWQAEDRNSDGEADLLFEINCGSTITTVPIIGDWNSATPGSEIAIGDQTGRIHLISETGQIVWQTAISNKALQRLMACRDVSAMRFVAIDEAGTIFAVDENGNIIWQKRFAGAGILNYPAFGDLDRDGRSDIVLTSTIGNLFILTHEGDFLPDFAGISTSSPLSNPALADVDGDGYLDIIVTGGGKIFAYRFNGTLLTNFPILIDRGAESEAYPDPILVDLDGDQKIEIIVASKNGLMNAFHSDGRKVNGFPLSISTPANSAPVIAHLTSDSLFCLIARSEDDFCHVWTLEYKFNDRQIYWRQFLNNERHSAIAQLPGSVPSRTGALMPEKTVYNYPNPTEGNWTIIRYYLREAAEVTIRIYDAAGELVEQLTGPGIGGIENERTWDVTRVQSGIYLARVTAKRANESSMVMIKIAVVK
ncbi:MAG: FG-GAP-like repeat-containing protein [candidate division KSB1 bacterium]|nr:FG-GAP-like repeat-containing protein [candidate division KSB1 bacterium]